jgi:acetyltransferase-like isoleucine patch superfamily enzyme
MKDMTGYQARVPPFSFALDDTGSSIADDAQIDEGVYLGRHVTVYPRVHLGANTTVMDGAVLGRIPLPNKSTTRPVSNEFRDLVIGPDSIIGCNAVLYTGSELGRNVLVSDLASIREGCHIGDEAVIGRGVMALYNCTIGNASRIQDQAHLVGNIIIEDHVFIGMGVITTNDNDIYLSRFGLVQPDFKGPIIRRLAVIGAGAVIFQGVEIGVGAMVAAGAVVTKDVRAWTVVAGVPARHFRDIPLDWRRRIETLYPA